MAIRDENYEGPFDEEGALDEIARLTRELEEARERERRMCYIIGSWNRNTFSRRTL